MNEVNYIIDVETEFIGNIVINELLNLYKKHLLNILSDKIQISFNLNRKVKEIDILLIGYLLLIKENNSNINFTFVFKEDDHRGLNILREYMFYSSLSFEKNVFDIKIENNINLTKEANLIIKNNFISRYFTPLIFISEKSKNFNYFFNLKIKDLIKSSFDWEKRNLIFINDDLFDQPVRDRYVVKDYNKVLELLIEYYIYYLDNTISEKNIYKTESKKPKVNDAIKEILIKIDYKELNTFSFIVFYLMVNGFIRENKINKQKAQIILKIFETAKDIERGIKELAKNFLEHTERKLGVIALRVFEKNNWKDLKKYCDNLQESENNGYDQFLQWTESLTNQKSTENKANNTLNFKNVLDINVIDLGNNGIIPTFINESFRSKNKYKKENTISKLFEEDIKKLIKGDFLLKNFFIFDSKSLLLQQTQRLTSHLGLLIFSKIVTDNHGFIRVFSKNKKYNYSHFKYDINSYYDDNLNNEKIFNDEFFESYSIFKNKCIDSSSKLLFGTCIQVTLPINEQPLGIENSDEIGDEKQPDKSQFRRIVEAFVIDIKPYKVIESNKKNVIYFYHVNSSKDELLEIDWNEIPSDLHEKKIKDYILDFKNCNIDESGLYRFLGLWEYYYPKINLIIINIDNKVVKNLYEIIKELYELNKDFKNADDLIFWNDNTFTLLYSFVEKKEKLFYFADILYGKTLVEFISANSHVALNNYNSISLVAEQSNKSKYFEFKTSLKTDILSENNILPLDLIIKSNEKTLFEHNAEFLLQQKMPNDDNN